MDSIYLQIFIFINGLIIGVIGTVAAQHAIAHFKPHKESEPHQATKQTVHLPPEVKERMLQASEAKFQTILDHSATELSRDLKTVSTQLNKRLETLGNEIASTEMKRYQADLEKLREQTDANIGSAQSEIEKHQTDLKTKLSERQTELEAKLTQDMIAEKQRLVEQIDTKLADAVASFLVETLGHNVDLGAQNTYLTTMLEEYKNEIIKEVKDEA